MDTMQRFMAYAADFEKTFEDDDWSRVKPYFADDAVYAVKGAAFACKLTGPDAICAGIKKSLDGFDRKFDRRDIEVVGQPEVDGDEITLSWKVLYQKEGLASYTLPGRSTVRYRDGKIAYLSDSYDPSVNETFIAWQRDNGFALDPSYT
jgi:hypothetical protein